MAVKPLLVSLKDTVSQELDDPNLSHAFRQIELWSKTVVSLGLPPPTTSPTTVSYTDPNTGTVWVAKAGVHGGQYRQARDVLHGRISRVAAWNTSVTAVQFSYDNPVRDQYGMFSTGGWLVPVAGIYLWTAALTGGSLAAGSYLQTDCQVNGTSIGTAVSAAASSGPGGNTVTTAVTTQQFFGAGDNLHVFQRAAAAVAGTVGGNNTFSTLDYLGSG